MHKSTCALLVITQTPKWVSAGHYE